jgi:hypothetical protein
MRGNKPMYLACLKNAIAFSRRYDILDLRYIYLSIMMLSGVGLVIFLLSSWVQNAELWHKLCVRQCKSKPKLKVALLCNATLSLGLSLE